MDLNSTRTAANTITPAAETPKPKYGERLLDYYAKKGDSLADEYKDPSRLAQLAYKKADDRDTMDYDTWSAYHGIGDFVEKAPTIAAKRKEAADFEAAKPADRGFLAGTGAAVGRGAMNVVSAVGQTLALADLTPNAIDTEKGYLDTMGEGMTKWAEDKKEKTQFMRPTMAEEADENSYVKKSWEGGVESIVTSATPIAAGFAGAKAGAAAGSAFGPVGMGIGGTIGGLGAYGLARFGMFGAGVYGDTYDKTYAELKQKNPGMAEDEVRRIANKGAWTDAISENVSEAVGDAAAFYTFGGTKIMQQPLKATIKDVMKRGVKGVAGDVARQMPFEVGSEVANAAVGAHWRKEAGLDGGDMKAAMVDAIGPAIVMSLLMGGGVAGYTEVKARKALNDINAADPNVRAKTANEIALQIKERTKDEELAETWRKEAFTRIESGDVIPIDEKIAEFGANKARIDAVDNGEDVAVIPDESEVAEAAKVDAPLSPAESLLTDGVKTTPVDVLMGTDSPSAILEQETEDLDAEWNRRMSDRQVEADARALDAEWETRRRIQELDAEITRLSTGRGKGTKKRLEAAQVAKQERKRLIDQLSQAGQNVNTSAQVMAELPASSPAVGNIPVEAAQQMQAEAPDLNAEWSARADEQQVNAQGRMLDAEWSKRQAEMEERAALLRKRAENLTAPEGKKNSPAREAKLQEVQAELQQIEAAQLSPAPDSIVAPPSAVDEGAISAPEIKTELDAVANEAATSPLNDTPEPTQAQKEAGNYKKGHVRINGLDFSIENPKGSERKGVDKDGRAWSTTMRNHYAYIKGSVGADKDHVDAFLSDAPESGRVFIVDQVDPKTGEFDEHKAMVGFETEAQAREAYLSNYEQGWQGLGAITPMEHADFKKWVFSKKTKKPVAVQPLATSPVVDQNVESVSDKADRPSAETVTAPVQAEASKEPWQMTRAEAISFGKSVSEKYRTRNRIANTLRSQTGSYQDSEEYKAADRDFAETRRAVIEKLGIVADNYSGGRGIDSQQKAERLSDAQIRAYHKRAVQKALSEGKPVPAEVLAEYPDLAPQSKPDQETADQQPQNKGENNQEVDGYVSTITDKMSAGRIKKKLSERISYRGKAMTRAEYVEAKLGEGYEPATRQEPKIKEMSRMASFRANNEQQRAHEKKMREAGNKTVYSLDKKDEGVSVDVTKIEHDYAVWVSSPPAATAAPVQEQAGPPAPKQDAAATAKEKAVARRAFVDRYEDKQSRIMAGNIAMADIEMLKANFRAGVLSDQKLFVKILDAASEGGVITREERNEISMETLKFVKDLKKITPKNEAHDRRVKRLSEIGHAGRQFWRELAEIAKEDNLTADQKRQLEIDARAVISSAEMEANKKTPTPEWVKINRDKTVEATIPEAAKEKLTLKQQKAWLLAEIDKAMKSDAKGGKPFEFHVPNDGHFRVKPENLAAFKEAVVARFPEKERPSAIGKNPPRPAQSSKGRVAEGEYYNEWSDHNQPLEPALHKHKAGVNLPYWDTDLNVLVDGYILVQMDAKPNVKGLKSKGDKGVAASPIEDLMKSFDNTLNDDAELVGVFKSMGEDKKGEDTEANPVILAHVRNKFNGKDAIFDAKKVDAVRTIHPDAKLKVDKDGAQLGFYKNGKLVGVVLGFTQAPEFSDYHKARIEEIAAKKEGRTPRVTAANTEVETSFTKDEQDGVDLLVGLAKGEAPKQDAPKSDAEQAKDFARANIDNARRAYEKWNEIREEHIKTDRKERQEASRYIRNYVAENGADPEIKDVAGRFKMSEEEVDSMIRSEGITAWGVGGPARNGVKYAMGSESHSDKVRSVLGLVKDGELKGLIGETKERSVETKPEAPARKRDNRTFRSIDTLNALTKPVEHEDWIKFADGSEWQAKQGYTARGWTLVRDGKAHPTIQSIEGQVELIGAIVQQQDALKTEKAKPEDAGTADAGQELTYNKRNRVNRGLSWSDLKDMNPTLRTKEAVKAKIIPKPDYQAMIDDGTHPAIVHIFKQVYDFIAAKPKPISRTQTEDEAIQLYIDSANRVMDEARKWATDGRGAEWVKSMGELMLARSGKGPISISELRQKGQAAGPYEALYPNGWSAARDEINALGSNRYLRGIQMGEDELVKALKDIDKGWPGTVPAWKKQGYSIVKIGEMKPTFYVGEDHKKQPYVYVHFSEGRNSAESVLVRGATSATDARVLEAVAQGRKMYDGKFALLSKGRKVVSAHDTEADAIAAAESVTKKKTGDGGIKEEGYSVEASSRTGVEHRMNGEDVTSEQLMKTFGFKGVNFGNWMKGKGNEAERQKHLNMAYDSFMDLAQILNVPPKAISLNGLLGLAIGAQGTGSAAAHFVPGVNEINLTRTGGAGAVAHEWAHGLDHYFANIAGLSRSTEPFVTEHTRSSNAAIGEMRPEVMERFAEIVKTMSNTPMSRAEVEAQIDSRKSVYVRNIDSWLKSMRQSYLHGITDSLMVNKNGKSVNFAEEFDRIAERIKIGDVEDGRVAVGRTTFVSPVVAELRDLYMLKKVGNQKPRAYSLEDFKALQANVDALLYYNSERAQDKVHEPQMRGSDYSNASAKKDKDKSGKRYWSTKLEMFARAFAGYVYDRLDAINAKNTYLVRPDSADSATQTAYVPIGEERKRINAAFDALLKELKTKETDKGVALYEEAELYGDGPGDADIRGGRGRDNNSRKADEGRMLPVRGGRIVELESIERRNVPAVVNNDAEAAAAVSFITRNAQENIVALVLDKDNAPLSIVRHGIGKKDSVLVDPATLVGSVLDVKGAASFYLIHNHPSGSGKLSPGDRKMHDSVLAMVDGAGVTMKSVIAITPTEYGTMTKTNVPLQQRAGDREKTVSVTDRVFSSVVAPEDEIIVTGSRGIIDHLDAITGGAESGIVLLNGRNVVTGFLPMTPDQMEKMRGGRLGDVLNAIHESNAISFVGVVPNIADLDKWRNVSSLANAAGILTRDAIYKDRGAGWASAAQMGAPYDSYGNVFYQTAPTTPSPVDLRAAFPWADSIETDGDGRTVITKGKVSFTVTQVDTISPDEASFQLAYGRKPGAQDQIAGEYRAGEIRLSKVADQWTVMHEYEHFLEDMGLITPFERGVLDAAIKKAEKDGTLKFDPGTGKDRMKPAELRAYYVQHELAARDFQRKTTLGRVLQKVADFIDALANLFVRTSRGVVRDVASGRMMGRESMDSAVSEAMQGFQTKDITETPAFKKWFGKSKARGIFYHWTNNVFDSFSKTSDIGFHFGTKASAKDRGSRIGGAEIGVEPVEAMRIDADTKAALNEPLSGNPASDLYALLLRKLDSPRPDLKSEIEKMTTKEIEATANEYRDKPDSPKAQERATRATDGASFRVIANGEVLSAHKTSREARARADKLRRDAAKPMAVYLRVENPIRLPDLGVWPAQEIAKESGFTMKERGAVALAGDEQAQYAKVREILMEKGYDGIVYTNQVEGIGTDSYIVFDPAQIKSVNNRGTFDPADPRIQYALAPTLQKAREFKDDLLTRPEVFGPLNFINTQLHKALKQPAFRRIFDRFHAAAGTQQRAAARAASLAPDILPDHSGNFKQSVRELFTKTRDFSIEDLKHVSRVMSMETLSGKDASPFSGHRLTDDELTRLEAGETITVGGNEIRMNAKQMKLYRQSRAALDQMLTEMATSEAWRIIRGVLTKHQSAAGEFDARDYWEVFADQPNEAGAAMQGMLDRELVKAQARLTQAEMNAHAIAGADDMDGFKAYGKTLTKLNKAIDNKEKFSKKQLEDGDLDEIIAKREERIEKLADELGIDASDAEERLKEYKAALKEYNDASQHVENVNGAFKQIADVFKKSEQLIKAGYAPLSRFGQYRIDVHNDKGELIHVSFYDTSTEAARERRRLIAAFDGYDGGAVVGAVETVSQEDWKQFQGANPEALRMFAQKAGADSEEVMQAYYQNAISSRSALKRLINRKGYAGYSEDLQRIMASFITSGSKRIGQNYHAADIAEMVDDRTLPADLRDEARKLKAFIDNPGDAGSGFRSFAANWYMLGSFMSAAWNGTQVFTSTVPELYKHGGSIKGATGEVLKAYRSLIRKGSDLSPTEKIALRRAMEDGTVDAAEIHHLYAQATKRFINKLGDGEAAKRVGAFLRLWGMPFSWFEVVNRKASFIAAYRMGEAQGVDDAYAFAKQIVDITQGIYAKHNRTNMARGAVMGSVMTFMQYKIMTLEQIARNAKEGGQARKAAALQLAIIAAMGGWKALPGIEDITDLYDTIMQTIFGKAVLSKKAMSEAVKQKSVEVAGLILEKESAGAVGKFFADMVNNGIVTATLPVDVSGKVAMGSLIPGLKLLKPSTQYRDGVVFDMAGVPGSMLDSLIDASGMILQGDMGRAAMRLAPNAVAAAAKGVDILATGEIRNTRGKKVTEGTPLNAALQIVGAQPKEKTRINTRLRENQELKFLTQAEEKSIVAEWADAYEKKGVVAQREALVAVRKRISDWNANNPKWPIVVKQSQVMNELKNRKKTTVELASKSAPKELRASMAVQ